MSKLNELIAEQCPNGVEYIPLWQVTIWDKRFTSVDRKKQPEIINYPYLLANDLFALQQDSGDVFLLSTGEKTGWTTVELAGKNLCEGEVVTIPWGKSRAVTDCIKYYKGKFVTADNRIATSSDPEVLSNKFLYYWMMSQGDTIDRFYRGSGIKHPSMKDVLDMQIPIPPMDVQSSIVRILDTFATTTEKVIQELYAEIELRKKQYEFYCDTAFEEIACKSPKQKISEIADTFIGLATSVTKWKREKGVLLLHNSDIRKNLIKCKDLEYIDEEFAQKNSKKILKLNDVITVHTGDVGTSAIVTEEYAGSVGFTTISSRVRDAEVITPEYLCFFLNSHLCKSVIASKTISDRNNLNLSTFDEILIPIPPVEEQKDLVDKLMKIDELFNDVIKNLSLEIVARKKQFEFYRNRLLQFKDVGSND